MNGLLIESGVSVDTAVFRSSSGPLRLLDPLDRGDPDPASWFATLRDPAERATLLALFVAALELHQAAIDLGGYPLVLPDLSAHHIDGDVLRMLRYEPLGVPTDPSVGSASRIGSAYRLEWAAPDGAAIFILTSPPVLDDFKAVEP